MQKSRQNCIATSENFPQKELPEQSSWHGKFATKNRQSTKPNASLTRITPRTAMMVSTTLANHTESHNDDLELDRR